MSPDNLSRLILCGLLGQHRIVGVTGLTVRVSRFGSRLVRGAPSCKRCGRSGVRDEQLPKANCIRVTGLNHGICRFECELLVIDVHAAKFSLQHWAKTVARAI